MLIHKRSKGNVPSQATEELTTKEKVNVLHNPLWYSCELNFQKKG